MRKMLKQYYEVRENNHWAGNLYMCVARLCEPEYTIMSILWIAPYQITTWKENTFCSDGQCIAK